MEAQVQSICKVANFHIRCVGSLWMYLTKVATEWVMYTFATSPLDSGNSLLAGVPSMYLNKLQRLQNTASCIVTHTYTYYHITPILYDLHWLTVTHMIEYKVLMLVYKAITALAA